MEKDTSEIAKLSERIAKDPKSKLFVPLAEEYKKTGQIEMAITVLSEGLKNNPGYATARSFLGRLLLDQGDLAGAQKELEEVVKAIPDNLLAQRKLGDLFILLGKNSEALERYKIARALNPVDKELAAIVSDLEAGKDVSTKVPKPKGQKISAEAKPAEPAAAPPQQKAAPSAATPAPVKAQQTASASVPKAAPAAPAAASAAPAAPASKHVPEAQQSAAPAPDVLEVEAEDVVEEIRETDILLEQPEAPKAPVKQKSQPVAETLPPLKAKTVDDPGSASFDLSEEFSGSPPDAEADAGVVWSPTEAATPAATPNDDINTDTLAELYIAQGFYDKAIEIYQRMLTDRPDNKVLQQKLLKLHALAGAQSESSFPVAPAPPSEVPAAPAQAGPAAVAPPPPPRPARATEAAEPLISREAAQVREPAADAVKRTETGDGETARPAGSSAAMRRKETIERLESWLKNVVKEKP